MRARPPADFLYPRGVWHYAQGLARVRQGRLDDAGVHLERLTAVIAEPALEGVTFWDMNLLTDLLGVARHVLAGEPPAARAPRRPRPPSASRRRGGTRTSS